MNEVQNFFQKLFTDREKSMEEWLDHDVSRYVQTRYCLAPFTLQSSALHSFTVPTTVPVMMMMMMISPFDQLGLQAPSSGV